MRQQREIIENNLTIAEFFSPGSTDNQAVEGGSLFRETMLTLEEYLAIPTFIRRGKRLKESVG